MSESVLCPNPRCPKPTDVQRIVLSGKGSASPNSARMRAQRRTVNRRLMEPRTMFATWGIAGGISGLLIVFGIYLIIFGLTRRGFNWEDGVALAAWAAAVPLMIWSRHAHTRPASQTRPQPTPQRPTNLYYCNACNHVFEPLSGRFARLDEAENLFA
jgi:hypothetical protein